MPNASPGRRGRIITFYSFKGGVGRTMALANVAFLAAMNRKRVLVMDWDLEAPGLHYYFRGMQDVAATRAIRQAPGILDFAWNWSVSLRQATDVGEAEAIADLYRSGQPFAEKAHSLLPDFEDDEFGVLHHIGAGGPMIAVPDIVPYEEALARFDWSTFFTEEAGGLLIAALRDWATANYDYIFLDSRTGFADVAGICTMQIPDFVALCYIYNRQNIDGIAQVAGAIRARRGADVDLRAVPMRVARENTSEEADARGRARKELMRKGGFTSEAVELDQKNLSIKQAPNVPFYETISLIASERPRGDQLALDYLNLASQLLATDLEMPVLYEEWVERVRRRLIPRQAAPAYVLELRSKEPERAIDEVTQLLENAIDEQVDNEVDDEYMRALIGTVTHLGRLSISPLEIVQMLNLALDLLRQLVAHDSPRWNMVFVDFVEFYLETLAATLEEDEEVLLLDESDAVLSALPGDDMKTRRLANRRRAAHLQLDYRHIDAAAQITAELGSLVDSLSGKLSGDVHYELLAAEMDHALLRGDLLALRDKHDGARRFYEIGLDKSDIAEVASRPDLLRLSFDLLLHIARLGGKSVSTAEAARFAVRATDLAVGTSMIVVHAAELGQIITAAHEAHLLEAFIERALSPNGRRHSQLVSYYGRSPRGASRFMRFVIDAFEFYIAVDRLPGDVIITNLFETVVLIGRTLVSRRTLIGLGRTNVRVEARLLAKLTKDRSPLLDQYHRQLIELQRLLDMRPSKRGE